MSTPPTPVAVRLAVLVLLLALVPFAAALEGADPAADERVWTALEADVSLACDAPAVDIVDAGMDLVDGRLVGRIRVLDPDAGFVCAGVERPVVVVARGIAYGVYDASVGGVSLGAWERRSPEGVVSGACAVIGFHDGAAHVPGFPCTATPTPGPMAESWSIPLVGEAVFPSGEVRAYDLRATIVKNIQVRTGAGGDLLGAADALDR